MGQMFLARTIVVSSRKPVKEDSSEEDPPKFGGSRIGYVGDV